MSMSFEEQLGLIVVCRRLTDHLVPCHDGLELLLVVAMLKDAPDHPKTTLKAAYDALVSKSGLGDSQGDSELLFNILLVCL